MSHSGLSCPASMAGLSSEGSGLANGACCFREKFFFWSLPSRLTLRRLALSKRERGGITDSPWPFFFLRPRADKRGKREKERIYHPFEHSKFRRRQCFLSSQTWWVHVSLALFADVDRGQFGLGHGCSVIHEADYRINVDIVIILRRSWGSPQLQNRGTVRVRNNFQTFWFNTGVYLTNQAYF